jgi:hypothetical protein
MTPDFEQIIKSIQQLPAVEQDKILQWLEEKRKPRSAGEDWQKGNEKFHLAMRWIDQNRQKFLGKWVCLDGETLISYGDDAKKVYEEAKAKGVKIPFIEQVREEETVPFWGGWD